MKRLFFYVIFLIISISAFSKDLVITKVSPSPIKIGDRTIAKGDIFSDEEIIYWSSMNQDMKVKPKSGGLPRHYSAAAFKSKNSKYNLSIKQYLNYCNKTNKPSTLGGGDLYIQKSEKSANYPEKRIALIIGNSIYSFLGKDLDCPISDAEDVTNMLNELGFDTYTLYDATNEDFHSALMKFSNVARSDQYDVALFYYCGHGNQNNGENYLLPCDAKNDTPEDIENWISFNAVFESLAETECKTKLAFLDACRNTPKWETQNIPSRLDSYNTLGSLVVYSTENNTVALGEQENDARNTPFGAAFLETVLKPSENISLTIKNISELVKKKTEYYTRFGEAPRQVYTFGVGDVDFSFFKQKFSKEQCLKIANQADELIQEGYSYEALQLCLDFMPLNESDNTIPYEAKLDATMRRILDFLSSNSWHFMRFDSNGILTKDCKYIISLQESYLYVYDAISVKLRSTICLNECSEDFLLGYLNDKIYVFDKTKILSFSPLDGKSLKTYTYNSLNYDIIGSFLSFNSIEYDEDFVTNDLFNNNPRFAHFKSIMQSIFSFFNIPKGCGLLDYCPEKKTAIITHDKIQSSYYGESYSISIYDCYNKKRIKNLSSLISNDEIDPSDENEGFSKAVFSKDGSKVILLKDYEQIGYIIDVDNNDAKIIDCGNDDCDHYSKWFYLNKNYLIHSSRAEGCLKIFDSRTLKLTDSIETPSGGEILNGLISDSGNECWIYTESEHLLCKKLSSLDYNKSFSAKQCRTLNFSYEDSILINNRFIIHNKNGIIVFNDLLGEYPQWSHKDKLNISICNDILDDKYLIVAQNNRFSGSDYLILSITDGTEIYRIYNYDVENSNVLFDKILYNKDLELLILFDSITGDHKDYYFPKYDELIEKCNIINNNH